MSTTLNMAERVLARAKNLQKLGRDADALGLLGRLSGWQELPTPVAEETHACLAALHLRYHRYAQARQHLTAALVHRPDHAPYHHLVGMTFDRDDKGEAKIAYKYYRKSLELDPNQSACQSALGFVALTLGKEEEGLRALRRAVELSPDDPEAIDKLVEGLERCGRLEEARLTLRAAWFRNRGIYAFQKRWSDFRFQQTCEAQQAGRHGGKDIREAEPPALLPFLRLAPGGSRRARDRKPARRLTASSLTYPHALPPVRVSDRKHA